MRNPRYKLVKGPDGITWVSLEPLAQDILERLDDPKIKETKGMDVSLNIVLGFVNSLIMESKKSDEAKNKSATH